MRKYIILPIITILILLLANPVLAAPPPDKYPAVQATDVEIVKKVTLKGVAPRGGKTSPTAAATGTLGEPCTGSKYAMVIGISDYPGSINDLDYCDDDAFEMKTV